jgi:3-hydroxybutyryl-CoA dehydrogenase
MANRSDSHTVVAVAGTGMMGPGIAATMALAGHNVALWGRTQESVSRGLASSGTILSFLQREDVVSADDADAARAALRGSSDLADVVRVASVVFESIPEDMRLKQQFFQELEQLVAGDAILASNTSGLRISEIAARLERPERAVTTHFYMPPHLVPLVDVVKGERTSDETLATIKALLTAAGKKPVLVLKDTPGQLGIRLLQAVNREAFNIVREGIASAEDVDLAIKNGPGLRFPVYGPLEHADIVGMELIESVASYVFPDLSRDTAPDVLQDMIKKGHLGAKSGRGFYDWSVRSADAVKAERDAFLLQRLKDQLRRDSSV